MQRTAAGVRRRWNSMRLMTWPTAQSRPLRPRVAPSEGLGAVTG